MRTTLYEMPSVYCYFLISLPHLLYATVYRTSTLTFLCERLLDLHVYFRYNTHEFPQMISQLENMSLPATGCSGAEDGRSHWTTIRQLPAGAPVGPGRLCRGVPGPAPAAESTGRHQGAAYPSHRG